MAPVAVASARTRTTRAAATPSNGNTNENVSRDDVAADSAADAAPGLYDAPIELTSPAAAAAGEALPSTCSTRSLCATRLTDLTLRSVHSTLNGCTCAMAETRGNC